jgi:hypothetical protein
LGACRIEEAITKSIQHRNQKWNTRENKAGMNLFSRRIKRTVPGTPFLECFQKGLVTLPLVPEGKLVKRGRTPVIDEAHVS